MTGPSKEEREAAEAAVRVTRRAIRRLDMLEWVIFAGAFLVAILGGAAVAWLIVQASGLSFRPVWIVTSLLLFVVPGGVTIFRQRREERAAAQASSKEAHDDHG